MLSGWHQGGLIRVRLTPRWCHLSSSLGWCRPGVIVTPGGHCTSCTYYLLQDVAQVASQWSRVATSPVGLYLVAGSVLNPADNRSTSVHS